MKGIVDRFEGKFVVIEVDGQSQDVSKNDVNSSVKVGDVVKLVDGIWTTDKIGTEKREKQIKELMEDVWED
ncbi:DUF3006 domain-containing protein [Paenibacillus sp. sgz302251]|uniref:DUF3006 domain-containing protein n=1 Tax=Paenibacillus sp. sgz302251 TaxID=3414493 RepID=UPI003C7B1BBC